jgi:hypothetical protein
MARLIQFLFESLDTVLQNVVLKNVLAPQIDSKVIFSPRRYLILEVSQSQRYWSTLEAATFRQLDILSKTV